jgi:hypothetical protein
VFKSSAIALVVCGTTAAALSASASLWSHVPPPATDVTAILRFQPERQNAGNGYVSSLDGLSISAFEENPDIRGQVAVRYKPQANDTTFVQINVENLLAFDPDAPGILPARYAVHVVGSNGAEGTITFYTEADGSGTPSGDFDQDLATGAQVSVYRILYPASADPFFVPDNLDPDWIRANAVLFRAFGP